MLSPVASLQCLMVNFIRPVDPQKGVKQSLWYLFSNRNLDKIIHISNEAIQDILWWKHNIGAYAPIFRENSSVIINTDVSSFRWGSSLGQNRTRGQFSTEQHIHNLELKVARASYVEIH